jgi:hypothetical protein
MTQGTLELVVTQTQGTYHLHFRMELELLAVTLVVRAVTLELVATRVSQNSSE